ncbi:MAG: M24 family metallopeptidase, partial [Candidatus Hodarchaeota archaeon]
EMASTLGITIQELKLSSGVIGIEAEDISLEFWKKLKKHLPSCKLLGSTRMIEEIRMIKSKHEIKNLKRACQITDTVFENVTEDSLRSGMTEIDVTKCICTKLIEEGAESWSFYPIVRSGNRSSLFGRSSGKKLTRGDMVLIDFGAQYEGYCADVTRMAIIGQPSKKQEQIFEAIQTIEQEIMEGFKEGIRASDVYRFTVQELKKAGYSKYQFGMIGHSLGIKTEERPIIAVDDQTTIRKNMVLAFEPGIYTPKFGVRLEDNFLITGKGIDVFSRFPKDLIGID